MLESDIISHCAPALAGIKTANMFSCKLTDRKLLDKEIRQTNMLLNPKGVFVELLKAGDSRALIYVYRKKQLERDLKRNGTMLLLHSCGYASCETGECIGHLKTRFGQSEGFPHEVGLFLGYPLEDVTGFIKEKGKNYKYAGIWKVYGDEEKMKRTFRRLKKCTAVYSRLFADGKTMTQLTVAA